MFASTLKVFGGTVELLYEVEARVLLHLLYLYVLLHLLYDLENARIAKNFIIFHNELNKLNNTGA